MRATTDYLLTLTLSYLFASYLLVDFCPAFMLTNGLQYSCYFGVYSSSRILNCTATSTSQLRVQLTNALANFSSVLGYETNIELTVMGLINPSESSCSLSTSSFMADNNQL